MLGPRATATLVLVCGLALVACGGASRNIVQGETPAPTQSDTAAPTPGRDQNTATLVADMSNGDPAGQTNGLVTEYDYSYWGMITVEGLAAGLSDLTGLDFAINDWSSGRGGVSVDWAPSATFLKGLGGTERQEAFFVSDDEALAWFLMDSLYRSIVASFGGVDLEVYYSMDGGLPLVVPGLSYPTEFPIDIPYMGSPFYLAHADSEGSAQR